MEWLQVFDINENIINKKILRGENPTGNEYIMIVYIFIKNSDNKFLLERNTSSNKWVVPGGHVSDPQPIEGIKRECKEELGINIDTANIKEIKTLNNNNRLFKIYYLESDIDLNDIKVQKEEVSEAKFYSFNEIDYLIESNEFRENNIEFVNAVKEYLQ